MKLRYGYTLIIYKGGIAALYILKYVGGVSMKFNPKPWAIILAIFSVIGLFYVINAVDNTECGNFSLGGSRRYSMETSTHYMCYEYHYCDCPLISFVFVVSILGVIIGTLGMFGKEKKIPSIRKNVIKIVAGILGVFIVIGSIMFRIQLSFDVILLLGSVILIISGIHGVVISKRQNEKYCGDDTEKNKSING